MMSRSKTLPSLSSSRQMMMAWKVSGLSQSPAIMASRPASMRLAIAISPLRERSSAEPMSRRYMRTGSLVRSAGSLAGFGLNRMLPDFEYLALAFGFLLPLFTGLHLFLKPNLFGLDHVDAHLAELRQNALDLLGVDLFGSQQRVDLVVGDITALLRGADQFLHGRVGKVEHGSVILGNLFRDLFFVRRHFDCAC